MVVDSSRTQQALPRPQRAPSERLLGRSCRRVEGPCAPLCTVPVEVILAVSTNHRSYICVQPPPPYNPAGSDQGERFHLSPAVRGGAERLLQGNGAEHSYVSGESNLRSHHCFPNSN